MSAWSTRIDALTEPDLQALATRLAARLQPGDAVMLQGPVGAGKTTLARALIQSVLHVPEDIPSPTFTLVQTYDTRVGEIWHCDLYRLGDVSELEELGLNEALEQAICLIEWPEMLHDNAPSTALWLALEPSSDGSTRSLTATGNAKRWQELFEGATT